MSHQIVECPGCLAKLRVRESQTVIKLVCPRCGEQLAVDPPEPGRAPQNPAQQRPNPVSGKPPGRNATPPDATQAAPGSTPPGTSAPARPTRGSASTRLPVQSQKDESPGSPAPVRTSQQSFMQKDGLLTGIFLGGAGGLLLLLLGGLVWWMRGSPVDANAVAQTPPETNPPVVTTTDTASSALNVPPAIAASDAPAETNPAAAAVTPPPTTNPSSNTPSQINPPASSVPAPDNGNGNAVATVSNDARKLKYGWKPDAEFNYQFSIQEGEGDSVSRTTGVCSYKVEGSANKSMDDEEGSGTGFVVGANGILATCAHVVEGARRMEVNLGGESYPATVVAVDAKSDVALIRINATGLPILTLADSDSVQLAESVRAIGYPLSDVLGTDVKVTTGTVAGIVQDKQRGKRIQIDAAINPGNSGGPVVNNAGQVVGVASAKLSGAAVTSVGFAAPINQLRLLATSVNMSFPVAAVGQELAGPEVARRVTPAVAYIRVWGNSGGRLYNVSYTASFSESQRAPSRIGRGFSMPGPPSFPSQTADRGRLIVNSLGEVVQFQGKEQLPAVLGPVGIFFLEPLDAYSESQWQTETERSLQRIKREDSGPFGRGSPFGGRRRFGGLSGFGDPFGRNQEDQVMETIPATERTSYRVENSLNNKISIAKSYEFSAVRSDGQPYLTIRGNGTVVFDTERGMPSSLEFNSKVQQQDEGKTVEVPVTISYTLRSVEDVQQEKDLAESNRKKAEEEKSTPNPVLVDEILAQLKAQEGGPGASQPLNRLSQIAVVDAKRDEVLRVMKNHMTNSNGFVRKSATEVFCTWATADQLPELRKVLEDTDGLMFEARKRAFQTVGKVGTAADYPSLIALITDGFLHHEVKAYLIGIGPPIEDPVLEKIDSIKDVSARNQLIEVLKKVGTRKSIETLEKLANDSTARHYATQALDAIRARE